MVVPMVVVVEDAYELGRMNIGLGPSILYRHGKEGWSI